MRGPFVRTIIHHEILDSTNNLAKQLAVEGRSDLPLLIRANRQSRGRGRGEHSWWSDAGSLTFSVLLDPAAHGLRPEHEPRLALASAVALVEAIISRFTINIPLGIRWPNDVEAGGRKLAGVLPERVETTNGVRVVIGIGVNVVTRLADAPPEVRRRAVSLAELCPGPLSDRDQDDLLRGLLTQWETALSQLARDDPHLAARWNELDTLRDEWVRVRLGTHTVEGLGRGIDAEGALLLAGERETHRIFGGRVPRDEED